MISSSSAIASSAPATSAKVFCGTSLSCNLARDLPNEKTRFPPCARLIKKKNKKPIRRIGKIEKRKETKIDCDGTSTFQPLVGEFALRASISVGSWRATYEASTLLSPLINTPGFKIKRIFCDLSIRTADSTSDCEIAARAREVSICV